MTDISVENSRTLAQTRVIVDILSRGLSHGRRVGCRPMLGEGRGFATDLHHIYLPWPLPPELSGPGLSCAIALQSAPSKELLAQLPLARLNRRERLALQIVEAAEAMGWVEQYWTGLALTLQKLAPEIVPMRTEALSAATLLERALQLVRARQVLLLPPVFGQLPVVRTALMSMAARRSQIESRLTWKFKKRLEKLNQWSIAVTGEGDTAARVVGDPDENEEDQLLDSRRARVGTPYPEWSMISQRYREDHVSVIESRVNSNNTRTVEVDHRLAAWFEQPIERGWKHRLEDGSDLDVDAIVDACNDDLAGKVHSDRFYRERLPATRDTACTLLIDRSGSLAQFGNLLHEISCANALAAAMDRARERYAAFAFWSDTRHHVAVEVLRDFDDGQRLQIDAQRLRPRGYTRIGGALRHVTMRLRKEPASRRILLVLGDAVPCDEGYEGRYAAADVVKAVEEAEQYGVTVAFIAVGTPPDDPLAEPLGNRFHRVSTIADLAPVLAEVHSRLTS